MGRAMRHLTASLTILLICIPVSVVATILLLPLWRWLEKTYGLEAVGHSGPAEWCYVGMLLVCVLTASLLYAARLGRAK